jgi:hypothetical protein
VTINLGLAALGFIGAAQFLASVWHPSLDARGTTEVVSGAVLALIALGLDGIRRRDEAFWLYLVGLYAVTSGLDLHLIPVRSQHVWIAMFLLGTALLVGAPFVQRRTWLVFGTSNLVSAAIWSQVTDARGGHSVWIGAVVTGSALLLDYFGKRRTAWWMYVGGLFVLLEGLAYLTFHNLSDYAMHGFGIVVGPPASRWLPLLAIGAALLVGFVLVGRKIWVVYGAQFIVVATVAAEIPSDRVAHGLIIAGVVFAIGLFADWRGERLTGFWLQLSGLLGIAVALVDLAANSPDADVRGWTPILVTAVILLLGAPLVRRRLWVVFGTAGLVAVFGHYLEANDWFRYVLLVIGLAAFVVGLVADRARSGEPAPAPPPPAPSA